MIFPRSSESFQGVSCRTGGGAPVETANKFSQLVLPLPQPVACVVCSNPFEIVRQRGRPQKFCSAACRAAQHKQQKLNWEQARRLKND